MLKTTPSPQPCLAGTGQAEEQGNVALFAHVGCAVHRQYVGIGEQEVLHREHGFLHFARITHASDQHFLGGEVDDHATVGVGAVTLGFTREPRGVQHFPFLASSRVVLFRVDEQATAEQVVPGGFRGHFHGQVVAVVRPYVNMGNEVVTLCHVATYPLPQRIELVGREFAVDWAPGNGIVGGRLIYDKAVHR
jgi:hypothetical protein